MTTDQALTIAEGEAQARALSMHDSFGVLLREADTLTVTDQPTYDAAALVLREIKARLQDLDTERKAQTRPLDGVKARIIAFFKPVEDALAAGKGTIERKMLDFQRHAQAERAAAQAKLDKAAAAERARLEAQANRAQVKGDIPKAVERQALADSVVTPEAPKAFERAAGTSTRTLWSAEVTDFAALVKAAAERPALLAALQPDQVALNKLAQAFKEQLDVPGVRAVSKQVLAATGR